MLIARGRPRKKLTTNMKLTPKLQKEYAEVIREEKKIKARKEILKQQIEDILGQDSIKTEYGKFNMVSRASWSYTPAVNALAEDLEILKVEEQEREIATKTENYSLRFKE